MKNIKSFLLILGVSAALASCGYHNDENPVGSWTSAAPESVTVASADSTPLMKTVNIEFKAPEDKKPGVVILTAEYSRNTVNATDSLNRKPYSVTASIQGTYSQADDEHDEYLLSFDKNTLSVKGTDAPVLGPITDNFLNSLSTYTSIDDVEVSKDGSRLSFETKSPKQELNFVKSK